MLKNTVDGSEILHQWRWVEFPLFTTGFVHPFGGCLGFLNHQQYTPGTWKWHPGKGDRSLVETIIFGLHSLNFGAVQIYHENQPVMWVNKPKTYMDVSKNMGFPPKSSILTGCSIIFTIHFGGDLPLLLETSIHGSVIVLLFFRHQVAHHRAISFHQGEGIGLSCRCQLGLSHRCLGVSEKKRHPNKKRIGGVMYIYIFANTYNIYI